MSAQKGYVWVKTAQSSLPNRKNFCQADSKPQPKKSKKSSISFPPSSKTPTRVYPTSPFSTAPWNPKKKRSTSISTFPNCKRPVKKNSACRPATKKAKTAWVQLYLFRCVQRIHQESLRFRSRIIRRGPQTVLLHQAPGRSRWRMTW